jgi:peptidoglycan/xylan/chitin deacetylase (PgdA/CDA1 family)
MLPALFALAVVAAPPGRIEWTFDDGPHAGTPKILDLLRCHQVKATFFILGGQLQTQASHNALFRTVKEHHSVANHLWTHRSPCKISATAFRWELRKTSRLLDKLLGSRRADGRLYRPPHGHRCHRDILKAEGYATEMWHVADLYLSAPQIWRRALRYLRRDKTTILLFHFDWRKLSQVMQLAADAGYIRRCSR